MIIVIITLLIAGSFSIGVVVGINLSDSQDAELE